MLYNKRNTIVRGDKMQTTQQFLNEYICKAGETIVQTNPHEWEIQKWTARTFRTLGNVWGAEQFDLNPSESIIKLNLKPNSRRTHLHLSVELLKEALTKGWIVEEVRFKKDGRTPESVYYRMGPGLWHYKRLKEEAAKKEEAVLKASLHKEISKMELILPERFLAEMKRFIAREKDAEGWGRERVGKFTHFLIAYLQLRQQKNRMDYKEIGATYYREIGGSKAFDHYRLPFITRLEKWIDAPIQELGILSLGSIVPLHFTGELTGDFSQYSIGTVHTTNDLAVAEENFQTSAEVLWLVENRAVLTRMATEAQFLKQTKSFVLGVDGQVRGAHRKMIQQLCQGASIQKVMIWVDHDKAGAIIARDLVELIGTRSYRLVGHEENIFSTYDAYLAWAKKVPDAEQEMTLGGEENWRKWLNQ